MSRGDAAFANAGGDQGVGEGATVGVGGTAAGAPPKAAFWLPPQPKMATLSSNETATSSPRSPKPGSSSPIKSSHQGWPSVAAVSRAGGVDARAASFDLTLQSDRR